MNERITIEVPSQTDLQVVRKQINELKEDVKTASTEDQPFFKMHVSMLEEKVRSLRQLIRNIKVNYRLRRNLNTQKKVNAAWLDLKRSLAETVEIIN
ncbi:MAG: hypothetical protein R2827_13795 [Bdellovibrionales bacterium]